VLFFLNRTIPTICNRHGEVFVLRDGGEVDLDLGNYERYLNIELSKDHNGGSPQLLESVTPVLMSNRLLLVKSTRLALKSHL
jgi:CTP synthase (UTP-ammonia lyase)